MPRKTTYTAQGVDQVLLRFEKAQVRYESVLEQKVKRHAAEKDLMRIAEISRNLFSEAVGGEKMLLEEVFGGDCRRFHRFKNIMAAVEFSASNASDERWEECKEQIETVEEVLKQAGGFKPWTVATEPQSITFPTMQADNLGFEDFLFEPIVEGTTIDTLTFTIWPPLPLGLQLDERTGVISGHPVDDVEVPEREYKITATNAAGSAEMTLKFGIKAAEPETIEYSTSNLMVGEEIYWEPTVQGGKVKQWSIEPELPPGMELDAETGIIVGFAAQVLQSGEYTVTGSNTSGTASATISFEITPAPPDTIKYEDSQNVDFPLGSPIYLMPEVIMKRPMELGAAVDNTLTQPQRRRGSAEAVGVRPSMLQPMGRRGSTGTRPSMQAPSDPGMRQRTSIRPVADGMKQWGRVYSSSGAYAGARMSRIQGSTWQSMVQQGVQPNIHFTVKPELPQGMSISRTTGVISGSPQVECERAMYAVTAENDQGSASVRLNFGVKLSAPEALEFPDVEDVLFEGQEYSLVPEVKGWVTKWEIEPELPPGLQFDETLGAISGVPEGQHPEGTWIVKAINSAGEAIAPVSFCVRRREPVRLAYPNMPSDLQLLRELKKLNPTVCDGNDRPVEVDLFEVEPPLPAGLQLDPKTGHISGEPTEVTDFSTYTITASNESGTCTQTLGFAVKVLPPCNLRYPTVDEVYGVGEMVILKPKAEGGASSWSVEPELPPGLSLSPETGLISGKLTDITEECTYAITASNEAGGTSVLLTFEVSAPAPTKIVYPEMGSRLECDRDISIQPVVTPNAAGCTFSVEPALPQGLEFDPETGAITGSPIERQDAATYEVKATTKMGEVSCTLNFVCEEPPENRFEVDEDFAQALEEITEITQLPKAPHHTAKIADWMIWMVHRAWLNDPTLLVFDFSNAQMPLPHLEPRVAPKLMKALQTNTHIESLLLSNTNLRNPQAHQLAEGLKVNETLKVLNIETNNVAPDGLIAIAQALNNRPQSGLTVLRISEMIGRGSNHGRPVEQAVAYMLMANSTITKLGFTPTDQHWANEINRRLLINQDLERRKRKQADQEGGDKVDMKAQKKVLTKVSFQSVPAQAVWEIFDPDDTKLGLARRFTSSRKLLPTREQLQNWARSQGEQLKFSEVAPVVKNFRTKLLEASVGLNIKGIDNLHNNCEGLLKSWKEKNDRLTLEVTTNTELWILESGNKVPIMEVSEEMAEWLAMEEDVGVVPTKSMITR